MWANSSSGSYRCVPYGLGTVPTNTYLDDKENGGMNHSRILSHWSDIRVYCSAPPACMSPYCQLHHIVILFINIQKTASVHLYKTPKNLPLNKCWKGNCNLCQPIYRWIIAIKMNLCINNTVNPYKHLSKSSHKVRKTLWTSSRMSLYSGFLWIIK